MQLVSFAIQHYVSIPYQKFTEKVIAALAVFQVIQRQTGDSDKANEFENDEMEVLWIEENCHPDVMVPIYILDRCVNPAKGEFHVTHNKVTFETNVPDESDTGSNKTVTLTENQIQRFMCGAIRRVNDIVMKNVKSYSEEIPIPDLGIVETESGLGFDNV